VGDLVIFLLDLVFAALVTVALTWLAGVLGRLASQDDPPGGGWGGWRRKPARPGPRNGPARSPQPVTRRPQRPTHGLRRP
jgi:hypothetical protein